MGRLEPIEGKQTKWEGLWWHPEFSGFSSGSISLADLRKFKGNVRLYVRKNKFYNNGENGRPNYCFCLKDSNANVFHLLEVEEEDEDGESIKDKIERLAEIMRKGNRNGDIMALPSESVGRANSLMQEAIDLIESITGEEWNFSYMTF